MAKVGRKPKDNSDPAQARRKLIGQQLSAFREHKNLTQADLAEELDTSVSTVQRYEYGTTQISQDNAEKLEILTGIIKEYWRGESDYCDRESYQYWSWSQEALNAAENLCTTNIKAEQQKFAQFFSVLGYTFEDTDLAFADDETLAAFDLGLWTTGPYRISKADAPDDSFATLTYKEFLALISQMKELVEFTCYKKQKQDHFPAIKRNQKYFGGPKRTPESK